jgi:predicted RecB family nuclease
MFVLDDVVVYSASDLAVAAGCEYALLRAFDAHLGRGPRVQADDELLARTALLGGEHEKRHLDKLRAQISEEPTVIGRPALEPPSLRRPSRPGKPCSAEHR